MSRTLASSSLIDPNVAAGSTRACSTDLTRARTPGVSCAWLRKRLAGASAAPRTAGRSAHRITTSVSMGASAQPSYWCLSGVACPADQELHGYDLLRQGARGAARGRERRQSRAPGTLLAVRDASAHDAGDRAATSVPAKGAGAYVSCKESCGQEGRGEQDGQQAGAQRPVRQVSCREAPGPPFAAWKAQVVRAAGSGDQVECGAGAATLNASST
jgi:hypothetical protein